MISQALIYREGADGEGIEGDVKRGEFEKSGNPFFSSFCGGVQRKLIWSLFFIGSISLFTTKYTYISQTIKLKTELCQKKNHCN